MTQFDFSAESLGLTRDDLNERTWRAVLAEFIATLLFVFIGAGAVAVGTGALPLAAEALDPATLTAIALAHGLAIAVLVAATARISGGHINPAVTFAAVITGRMKAGPGVLYVAAQLVGAVVGALLLDAVLVSEVEGNLGAHQLSDTALSSDFAGLIVEIILTFMLVFTVFAVAIDPRGPSNLAPIAIGLAVLIDHFVGVPLTGASMNPARSFGPALVANAWDDHWVYWIGPLAGGALAGLIYYFVYLTRDDEDGVRQEPVSA
ncbi:MAG TPA: MIP family channel protein [Gemmatimonadales bacterium]|nr:MIP family channel protein [Gemmatimonadales bacterium]